MAQDAKRHLPRLRELETKASAADRIAKEARRQKVLAKADLRAARKSLKVAKKVAKQTQRAAREISSVVPRGFTNPVRFNGGA